MVKPALRKLWRDAVTVQLGVDPTRAVVLEAGDLADLALLDLLDGSRPTSAIVADAQRLGHPPEAVTTLVGSLLAAGALDDGAAGTSVEARLQPDLLSLSLLHPPPGAAHAVMRRRHASRVGVYGAGRVGATVVALLAAAGVGQVEVTDEEPVREVDLSPGGLRGFPRGGASRAAAARVLVKALGRTPTTKPAPARAALTGATSVLVLAPTGSVIPPEWLAPAASRPHLPVVIRETTATVGPLVQPGRTPCVRCVELARADRDPAWPSLTAQLLGMSKRPEPCDVTLATLAAALAAMQVLAVLDNAGPATPDRPAACDALVLEFSLADLRLRRRTVQAHPECGCGAA